VGADGIIFLDKTPPGRSGDYTWHFYNADGSRGEMCGNGSRCAAWLAVDLGLAGPRHVFGTDAGLIEAEVRFAERWIRVELTHPQRLALHIPLEADGESFDAHFADTGVPHAVILLPRAQDADVPRFGPLLRRHPHFGRAGANVNFVSVEAPGRIRVRTFERGVEAETLACGTGAAASACIARELGLTDAAVDVITSGGEVLGVELREGAVFLSGRVVRVFTGELDPRGAALPW
jgi:diaminopimelate epimerase